MSVKIGGREVVASETLLIPEGESAWIEFVALSWKVKLKVELERVEDRNVQAMAQILAGENNEYGVLKISHFGGEGTSFPPFKFGETEGRNVYVAALGRSVGDITQITFQFLLEEEK